MASVRQRKIQNSDQKISENVETSTELTEINGNSEKKALLDKNESNNGDDGSQETLAVDRRSLIQKAMSQTLTSTGHLANLLPTGTLLAFQILCPIVSNNGRCDSVSRLMTEALLILCAISCFLVSFTDSFKGGDGQIYYGFATPKGLWAFDYTGTEIPGAAKYRIRFVDFVHAFLSVLVFVAIALYDHNVVHCFYPAPEYQTKEVLDVLPVAIGAFCSLLFVVFPTTRHGFGYPVSKS